MASRDHAKGCRVSCLLNLHGARMRRQDTRAKTVQLSWLSQDSNQICLVPNHVLHHHADDFGIFSKCVIVFKALRSFTVKKPNCVLMGNFSDLTLEIWVVFF